MTGIEQYRAYRVMIVLFRSLWFLDDVVGQYVQDTHKEPKDIVFREFGEWFFNLDAAKRKTYFKFALLFGASLEQDEMLSVLKFRQDNNGVAYSKENIKNIKLSEMVETIADVCVELSEEKVFF